MSLTRVSSVLGLVALAGVSAAGGDVRAYADASGDLWVIADDANNGVRVYANHEDSYTVAGLNATTTVNGQAQVTLVALGRRMVLVLGGGDNEAWLSTDHGAPNVHVFRELVVIGGSGQDRLLLKGPVPRMNADLGPGDDFVFVSESAGGLDGTLLFGAGDDELSIDEAAGFYGSVDFGAGNDRLESNESPVVGRVVLGPGDDRVSMISADAVDMDLDAGDGEDVLELDLLWGTLTLDTGDGRDRVRVTGHPASMWSRPLESLSVVLGEGEDRLELGDVELGTVDLDGGPGADAYSDRGGIVFDAGPPALHSFESRLGGSAPTRITGRVVAEGEPVPGAVVLLPELGLSTSTDAGGAFSFEAVSNERGALELTLGATVRGRPRSGAARVELASVGATEVGDIALEPGLCNVLVFGVPADRTDRAGFLEGNLESLGFRPVEVTTLERLPSELAPYGVVWHVGGVVPAEAQLALVDFVRAGRGLHLCGGGPAQNASLEALVNQLVSGAGIAVGVSGTATTGFYTFNPDAAGGVTTTPNLLARFYRSAFARYVTGLKPRNVLLSMTASCDVPGAVWDSSDLVGGRGHVTLVMDASWIAPGESLDVLENLQAFLAREPEGLPSR